MNLVWGGKQSKLRSTKIDRLSGLPPAVACNQDILHQTRYS